MVSSSRVGAAVWVDMLVRGSWANSSSEAIPVALALAADVPMVVTMVCVMAFRAGDALMGMESMRVSTNMGRTGIW
jgi:4-diphosphocytidyl-2C-methyl-D-erythritol kinase